MNLKEVLKPFTFLDIHNVKFTLDYTCYKKLSEKRKKRKICFRNILLEFEGPPLSAIFKNINIFPNIY